MTEKEFDDLIKKAGEIAIEEMESEAKEDLEEEPHEFSEEFEERMKKFFEKHKNNSDKSGN